MKFYTVVFEMQQRGAPAHAEDLVWRAIMAVNERVLPRKSARGKRAGDTLSTWADLIRRRAIRDGDLACARALDGMRRDGWWTRHAAMEGGAA